MIIRLLAMTIAVAVVAGCATKPARHAEAQAYFKHMGEPVEDVRAFRLTDWRPLDRYHLVVWRSVNEAFVIRVQEPCTNIDFARSVAVEFQAPVLRSRFDFVRIDGDRCRIEEIRPVDYRLVRQEMRTVRGR
ncbi:MAG TPA: DUF6491 family protein [Xanthomonadaceae bacterium]|nr:DUF6491 family protein [Xanthomonadaceae bacterium]